MQFKIDKHGQLNVTLPDGITYVAPAEKTEELAMMLLPIVVVALDDAGYRATYDTILRWTTSLAP